MQVGNHRDHEPEETAENHEDRDQAEFASVGVKRMYDIAIWILAVLATLVLSLFGILYSAHKLQAVALFGTAVLLFDIAGCLLWAKYITSEKAKAQTTIQAIPASPLPTATSTPSQDVISIRNLPREKTIMPDPKDDKPDQPGSVNQRMDNSPGGLQVGGNLTIDNIPEPKLDITMLKANAPEGGIYKTTCRLQIDTKVPIPNLSLRVSAPSIKGMEVFAQRSGMDMTGQAGCRDGFCYTNLQQAHGTYLITITTATPDRFDVSYDY